MVLIRRAIHFAAWIGTLLVGLLALALIVSQTPWFRDWIRRAIIREARQYVNGEVSIGKVTGNLFFDFGLADVAVDLSGDRVVAIKALAVDYSVFQLISGGIIVDHVTVTAPRVHLARGADGWNIGRLVKTRDREANRRGPGRSISLPSIAIVDGTIAIDDDSGPRSFRMPRRIEDLDVQASFAYEPVHFTIGLNQFSFRGADPELTVQLLTGTVAVRNDNLYLDRVAVKTGESALNIGGVIESYLRTPVIKLATDGTVSLPEVGRLVPALAGYQLHPKLVVNANGTLDRLLLDLHLTTEAGLVRGPLMTDLRSPDFAFSGPLHLERLNLAPILKNPAQRSDITGEVRINLTLPSNPSSTPVMKRLGGTFSFAGPRVVALGYEATQVRARGAFTGPRITLADASVRAYGGSATTRGLIVLPEGRRAVSYDLQGTANEVDLRRLPASTRAPQLETVLAIADYHVQGLGSEVHGSATLNRSLVEGATIETGTVVAFDTRPDPLTYSAQGTVARLDVRRLGRALEIQSLDDERYAGRVSGTFDVQAAGASLDELRLSASGTLSDSAMWGTHVPEMSFKAGIADSALTLHAKGAFDQLNPAVLLERKALDGNVTGIVDATLRWRDLSAPISPALFDVDGRVVLRPSLIGGVQVAGAEVEGRYAAETADIARLRVDGPDVTLDASGRLALGRAGTSDLRYLITATDITELGRIAGRSGLDGTLALDGRITGNAASLETAGTLKGNGLAYGESRVLDLDSTYAVNVADLDFRNARVQAASAATFLVIGGVELNQLSAKTTYAQNRLEFDTTVQQQTRELGATGSVIFHPDHQELHLPSLALRADGLSLGSPVIEWRNVTGSEAAIRYRGNVVSIEDLRLANGDQTLDVSGAMAVDAANTALTPDVTGATASLEVHARNLDLAQAEKLALQDRGLSGRLTADATITGSLRQPKVAGKVQITDGGFRAYKFQSLIADVGHAGNRITLDATLQQAPGIAITARGTVPTTVFQTAMGGHVAGTPEDAIDVRVQTAALNLGVIQGFTTAVTQVGGTLEADVRIIGSGNDPHVVGFLEVRDGAFAVPRLGTSYSGLDTRIDLEPDVVRVRRFEILDENGEQLAVAGQLAVHERQIGAVDFTLESQNFEIIDNELGDLGVGTALKVTGELTRPTLEGDIRVAAGRLEIDRILRLFYDPYSIEALPEVVSAARASEGAGSAQDATRQALARAGQAGQIGKGVAAGGAVSAPAAKEPGASASVFSNVALDVRVRIPDNLVARGRRLRPGGPTRAAMGDINITLGGDLNVRKAAGGPVTVAGTINTVRGTYQFQGRQFEIARNGTLRFTGGADFDPVLDLTATRQIPDTGVEARVRITGSLQSPALALTSTPPLEESDVLALIVFNRPINELGTGERASLAATAGGIATGFLAAPLGESIGRALDLDLFEITTSSEGDTFGAGFTVGEQIGSRTFLKLRQQFGDRTYSEFLLEYQINDFLRLVGSAAPEASGAANRIGQRRIERAGLDLIFFFSY
jgi:translocation and assembly module TamB